MLSKQPKSVTLQLAEHVIEEVRYVLRCSECDEELTFDEWSKDRLVSEALRDGWTIGPNGPLCYECEGTNEDS